MADRVIMPRALDASGDVVDDAVAHFFQLGSTAELTVYTDSTGETELGTTLQADAEGVFDPVYSSQPLRLDIRGGDGVSLPGFPSNMWHVTPTNGVGASTITFSPIEGNEAVEVQGAIANLTGFWNAVTSFGKTLMATTGASNARATLNLGGLATLNILDEDDFASDSNTRPPSQQSVAAYLEAALAALPVKARCTFNGTGTPAIIDGSGVSGITDNGVGDYTLTFDPPMPNSTYQVFLSCSGFNDAIEANGNRVVANVKTDASGIVLKSPTELRITTDLGATGTFVDVDEVYVSIMS